jgi:hypothetical protein
MPSIGDSRIPLAVHESNPSAASRAMNLMSTSMTLTDGTVIRKVAQDRSFTRRLAVTGDAPDEAAVKVS